MTKTFWLAIISLLSPPFFFIYGQYGAEGISLSLIGLLYTFGATNLNLAGSPSTGSISYYIPFDFGITLWDPTIFLNPGTYQSGITGIQATNLQNTLTIFTLQLTEFGSIGISAWIFLLSIITIIAGVVLEYYVSKSTIRSTLGLYGSLISSMLFFIAASLQLAFINVVQSTMNGWIDQKISTLQTVIILPFGTFFLIAAGISALYSPQVLQSSKIRWLAHFLIIGGILHISYGLSIILENGTSPFTAASYPGFIALILGLIALPAAYGIYNLKVWGRQLIIITLSLTILFNLYLLFRYEFQIFGLVDSLVLYDNNFWIEIVAFFVGTTANSIASLPDYNFGGYVGLSVIIFVNLYYIYYFLVNKAPFIHK